MSHPNTHPLTAIGYGLASVFALAVTASLIYLGLTSLDGPHTIERIVVAGVAIAGALAAARIAAGFGLTSIVVAVGAGRAWASSLSRAAERATPALLRGVVRRGLGYAMAGSAGLIPITMPMVADQILVEAPTPGPIEDLGWRPTGVLDAPWPSPLATPTPAATPTAPPTTSASPSASPDAPSPAPSQAALRAPAPPAPAATSVPSSTPSAQAEPDPQPTPTGAPSADPSGRHQPATASGTTARDESAPPRSGVVTVMAGECLWDIAHRDLGPAASHADIDAHWRHWYEANATTIGPDPDLILPGQRLTPPEEAP